MHGNNGFGFVSDGTSQLGDVHIVRVAFYIHQFHRGANQLNDIERGSKGHGGGNDFIAWLEVQGHQSEV